MTPNEALTPSCRNTVFQTQEKYGREFEKKNSGYSKLNINDTVLIKKGVRDSKMDNEFEVAGKIEKVLGSDAYEVRSRRIKLIRHASQLKRIGGGCWMSRILSLILQHETKMLEIRDLINYLKHLFQIKIYKQKFINKYVIF
ncbi:hypothetical protein NGRA_1917 [Nosema granulosis]|uniref:Uncharacterized protein n=1 Tax=Nosema granulosis TaxID=83296 RepID=A0A9P6KYN0_9MICR|nr:hypothetical protein NGRA_1917 [Nosema granulosis]